MDPTTEKYARLFKALHAAARSLDKAGGSATPSDVQGCTVSANVLLQIARAEALIAEVRHLIGVPSPIWRRPLPEPSLN